MESDISRRHQERQAKKAAENAAGLTLAEQLTRASREETAKVLIPYSEGDLSIEMRLALVSEQQSVRKLSKNATSDIIGAEKELAKMFAEHSIDDSLDYDFWMRADISPSIFQKLLHAILGLSEDQIRKANEIIEAKSFRSD